MLIRMPASAPARATGDAVPELEARPEIPPIVLFDATLCWAMPG
jgi:hypothetical protein